MDQKSQIPYIPCTTCERGKSNFTIKQVSQGGKNIALEKALTYMQLGGQVLAKTPTRLWCQSHRHFLLLSWLYRKNKTVRVKGIPVGISLGLTCSQCLWDSCAKTELERKLRSHVGDLRTTVWKVPKRSLENAQVNSGYKTLLSLEWPQASCYITALIWTWSKSILTRHECQES